MIILKRLFVIFKNLFLAAVKPVFEYLTGWEQQEKDRLQTAGFLTKHNAHPV